MATPRKLRCTVSEILDHGDRVYTLRLKPEFPAPRFTAGQFLHLAIDPYDPSAFWPDSRVFSVASPPDQRDGLEILYSVVGRFTSRMEAELRVGSEVWAKLPYGEFVVAALPGTEAALLAGGTGVSAFTAFLRGYAACGGDDGSRVHLFYGARHPGLLLFRGLLQRLALARPTLRATFFAESGAAPGQGVEPGRLSLAAAWSALQRPAAATYYLSGPPAMIRGLGAELAARGIPPERIRVDAWD
ncbi:MAG: FAD-dependent oxidoreductase [Elusimicrobia bacterium]|nr:FAD-dependent oxidoreductase [Elusimicrobiota bacterium]